MPPAADSCRHCNMSRLSCVSHAMRFEGLRCCAKCSHRMLHRVDMPYWVVAALTLAALVALAIFFVKDHL